jgi:uncharacterized protein YndB with AHSA1/START domain
MASIKHELWIDAPADKVYKLLGTAEGISSWWDQQTERQTADGLIWEHSPGPEHGTVQFLVTRREANRTLQWKCVSHHDASTPASAWTGTVITFTLADRAASKVASAKWAEPIPVRTVLFFSHEGWDEQSPYLGFCNTAWAEVLQKLASTAQGE